MPVMLRISIKRLEVLDQPVAVDVTHDRDRDHPRRIGRVMQVGPPDPLMPISRAG
jgi:hypothetical protein